METVGRVGGEDCAETVIARRLSWRVRSWDSIAWARGRGVDGAAVVVTGGLGNEGIVVVV